MASKAKVISMVANFEIFFGMVTPMSNHIMPI